MKKRMCEKLRKILVDTIQILFQNQHYTLSLKPPFYSYLDTSKKFGTSTTTMQCLFLHKNDFRIMIVLADTAYSFSAVLACIEAPRGQYLLFLMPDFDDFDNDQVS